MPLPASAAPRRGRARWRSWPSSVFAKPDGWAESHHTSGADWPAASVSPVHLFADTQWHEGETAGVEALLEDGALLGFPRLPFAVAPSEQPLLDGAERTLWLRRPGASLRGTRSSPADRVALRAMLGRYADHAEALLVRLCPHYRGHLRAGRTLFRPAPAAAQATGWRVDDTRLHVDADAVHPTAGARVLRLCSNVDAGGRQHPWRVGEPFPAHARRYLASLTRPLPGAARLLQVLAFTRGCRTEYDHLMLQLHDHAMADLDFQRNSPQAEIEFAPGSTWLVFGDQVPHAAMAGPNLIEQVFHLEVEHLQRPETAPLRTLERLLHRPLR